MTYREIYYTSSEQGQISGSDGFGIRAFTADVPESVLEELKLKNIFYYQAGKKMLPGSYELSQNPDLINDFPATFYYGKVASAKEIDRDFFLLARTVYIGRDFGWYQDDPQENARSGNTFTHVLVFPEYDHNILTLAAQPGIFRPSLLTNNSNNPELKQLLTGLPPALSEKRIDPKLLVSDVPNEGAKGLLYFLLARQRKVPCVINAFNDDTPKLIDELTRLLPNCIKQHALTVKTNYSEFFFEPATTLTFINEYFPNSVSNTATDYVLYDKINGEATNVPSSPLFDFLTHCESEEVAIFVNKMDYILSVWTDEVDLEALFVVYQYYYQTKENELSAVDVLKSLQILSKCKLGASFIRERDQQIIEKLEQQLESVDQSGIQETLMIVKSLGLKLPVQIKSLLTEYLLRPKSLVTLLTAKLEVNDLLVLANSDQLVNQLAQLKSSVVEERYFEQFLTHFLNVYPQREEALLLECLYGEFAGPTFLERKLNQFPTERIGKLLESEKLFGRLNPEFGTKAVGGIIEVHLDRLAKGNLNQHKRGIELLERSLSESPHVLLYSSYFTLKILENSTGFDKVNLILDHLNYLATRKVGYWEVTVEKVGIKLLDILFEQVHYLSDKQSVDSVNKKLKELNRAVEQSLKHGNRSRKLKTFLDSSESFLEIRLVESGEAFAKFDWGKYSEADRKTLSFAFRNIALRLLEFEDDRSSYDKAIQRLLKSNNLYFDKGESSKIIGFFIKEMAEYFEHHNEKFDIELVLPFFLLLFHSISRLREKSKDKNMKKNLLTTQAKGLANLKKHQPKVYEELLEKTPSLKDLSSQSGMVSKMKGAFGSLLKRK